MLHHRDVPSVPGRFGRRAVLGAAITAGAAAVGLSGCSDPTEQTNTAARNAGAALPTYTPLELVEADVPGTDTVMPGYYRYPTKVTVPDEPPGAGLDPVSIMYPTFVPVPPEPAKNAFWTNLQTALGVELALQFVPSPDYVAKFAATIAGGDLPEVMGYPLPTADQPRMMDRLFADLGPFLSGDAAKDFPALAAIPTPSWRPAVANGTIFAVPQPRALSGTAMYARLDLLGQVGAEAQPTSFDGLLETLRAVTDPKARRWAFANTTNMVKHVQMMLGAPNGWSESGGTFTHALADEKSLRAVTLVADMVKEGLFHPDTASITYTRIRELFFAGQVALTSDGYAGWDLFVRSLGGGAAGTAKLGLVVEPRFDGGGDAAHFAGSPIQGITVIKKGLGDERTRGILRVLDALAAPIGSQLHRDRKYGVEGKDFTLVDGVPTLTDQGSREFMDVQYVVDAQTIIGPGPQDGVDRQHAWHERVCRDLVEDPTVGLYSDTYARKGTNLGAVLADAQNEVIYGRKPIGHLQDAFAQWRRDGGDAIAAEYAESKAANG